MPGDPGGTESLDGQQRVAREPGAEHDRRCVQRDEGRTWPPIDEHRALELPRLGLLERRAAGRGQRGQQRLGDCGHCDHAVLRRTARCVVEHLGSSNLVRGVGEIGGLVDDHGDVARADPAGDFVAGDKGGDDFAP